jgi:hypothetical protein
VIFSRRPKERRRQVGRLRAQEEVVRERDSLEERRAEVSGELKKQQQGIYNNSELVNTRPSCTLSTSAEAGAAPERLLGSLRALIWSQRDVRSIAAGRYASTIGSHETPVSSSLRFHRDCALLEVLHAPDP